MKTNPASAFTVLLGFSQTNTRDKLSVMFSKWDFTILTAVSGKELLNAFVGHPETSLVILAVDLGDTNGFEIIKQIRSFRDDIPVFLLAAYISFESLKLASLLGCNEILQAPVGEKELKSLVSKYLFNSYTDIHEPV